MDAFLEEIKRSDQNARHSCSQFSFQRYEGIRQTERHDLLGIVSSSPRVSLSMLTAVPKAHARSATAMAG